MLDVLPPSDVALERDVLAIALMNGRPPNVSPEVFYDTNNRMVKVAMEKVASSRIEMDLVSLLDAIDPKYHDYLVEICDHRSGVSTVNEEYHENRLIKIYNQRELVRLGHFIINTAQKTNCDVEALVANIRNACGVLGDPRDKDSIMIGEINQAMVEKAIGALDSPVETVGIKSGLPKLDRVLLGFQGGKLYIIAARPSVGKSALGHNVILQAARDGHQVLIFSAEMNREAVWYREMAGLTGISTTALKTGRSPSNEKAIVGGGQVIEGLPIRIFDGSRVTEQTVSAAAAKFQPDLVVIDYLQRMRSSMPKKDRHDLEIGHISWSLEVEIGRAHV